MIEHVGKVTEQEKVALIELVEKKAALENLKMLNLDDAVNKRISNDLENVQSLMQDWWNNNVSKYDWKGKGSNRNWEMAFSTGEIFLT